MENKELKEGFIDEKTRIECVRQGDYYNVREWILGS